MRSSSVSVASWMRCTLSSLPLQLDLVLANLGSMGAIKAFSQDSVRGWRFHKRVPRGWPGSRKLRSQAFGWPWSDLQHGG